MADAISLASAFSFWRSYSARNCLETLFALQLGAEVSGGTLDKARGQGHRWHDRAWLFFSRGVTFSSDALRCVAVNWGNNSLLKKTYLYAFPPRKQRIF